MKSFFCLLVVCLVGGMAAQAPGPVYRSAPTVLKQSQPQPRLDNTPNQPAAPQTLVPQPNQQGQPRAEERESQQFSSTADQQAASKVGAGNPVVAGQAAQTVQGQVQTPGQSPNGQYTMIYVPQREAFTDPAVGTQTAQTYVTPYAGYQAPGVGGVQGQGVIAPVSEGFWNNINWKDTGVALACIVLVGAGGAMLYPRLAHFKARAMRELAELDAEDAKRVARNVFTAIKKFSDLNRN